MKTFQLFFWSALLLNTIQTHAESAAEAMKSFGLIGTWSADCAHDPIKNDVRSTFNAPFFGRPTTTYVFRQPKRTGRTTNEAMTIVTESEINSAVRITDEKIQIVSTQINGTMTIAGEAKPFGEKVTIEYVLQKIGNKIKTLDSHTTDGKIVFAKEGISYRPSGASGEWQKTEEETALREKCLN